MSNPTKYQKVAATRIGLPVEVYILRKAAGLRHCWDCKQWKAIDPFFSPNRKCCKQCYNIRQRDLYARKHDQYTAAARARYARTHHYS